MFLLIVLYYLTMRSDLGQFEHTFWTCFSKIEGSIIPWEAMSVQNLPVFSGLYIMLELSTSVILHGGTHQ